MTGSLVCVGTGMTLGSHISPLSRSYIENAEVVFSMVSSGVTEQWITSMNTDVRDLQPLYGEGKSRHQTYREMIELILTEVRQGKKVVGAFYGHPGVFAKVPHQAILKARHEGFQAHMEPGISAEDCLFADLGIDPGEFGCQHYETSQFMFYKRVIDPSAYLILWQIGMAGDKSHAKYVTDSRYRSLLVDLLQEYYPNNHQVILYKAKVLPIDKIRNEKLSLVELPFAEVSQHTTLIIPPCNKMIKNKQVLDKLKLLDKVPLTKTNEPFIKLVK